jgi:hypothetical protein
MRYIIPFTLVVMCILYTAGAAEYINNFQNAIESYNKNFDKVPESIKNLLENEKVNITISLDDGSQLRCGFETKNSWIVGYAQGGLKNPTIEVYATEKAINDVQKAADPAASILKAETSGNIRIEGRTLSSSLRLRTALIDPNDIKLFLGLIKSLVITDKPVRGESK